MEGTPAQERVKTVAEWIDVCLNSVNRMEEAKTLELPEPEIPRSGATVEEKAAAMDEWAEYKFSKLMASLSGGKGKGSIGAASRSIAYMQALPPLTSRAATKAFIACLAVGLQRKLVTGEEVKLLMYTAQLALQAYQPRAKRSPSPHPRHGRQGDVSTIQAVAEVFAGWKGTQKELDQETDQRENPRQTGLSAMAKNELGNWEADDNNPAWTIPSNTTGPAKVEGWNPTCATCGDIMRRAGSCYCCATCGNTSGCS